MLFKIRISKVRAVSIGGAYREVVGEQYVGIIGMIRKAHVVRF
jgi:hypothetical protein